MRARYEYRRSDYSGNGRALNSSNLSRHHTIAYPHMYEFGVILLSYFQLLRDKLDQDPCFLRFQDYYRGRNEVSSQTIQTILSRHTGELNGEFDYRENECRGFFKTVAWTESNLFTGPAGKFRRNDPGQGMDQIPVSSEASAFIRKLKELRGAGIEGSIPVNQGENGWINLREDKLCSIARGFIEALPQTSRLLETKVRDWRAALYGNGMANQGYDAYDIFFSKNPKNDKLEHFEFQLELAENPAFIPARQRRQRLNNDSVAVLTGIGHAGNRDFFFGVLKKKNRAFEEQADHAIADHIPEIE